MNSTRVKSYKYQVGKNHYIVIQIFQNATAEAKSGNVLASNAVNVKVYQKRHR